MQCVLWISKNVSRKVGVDPRGLQLGEKPAYALPAPASQNSFSSAPHLTPQLTWQLTHTKAFQWLPLLHQLLFLLSYVILHLDQENYSRKYLGWKISASLELLQGGWQSNCGKEQDHRPK